MHESSLARQILDALLDRAGTAAAQRVRAVHGWIAENEVLSPQSLRLHFSAHARGTLAEGAKLELRLIHVEARCRACNTKYAPDHHLLPVSCLREHRWRGAGQQDSASTRWRWTERARSRRHCRGYRPRRRFSALHPCGGARIVRVGPKRGRRSASGSRGGRIERSRAFSRRCALHRAAGEQAACMHVQAGPAGMVAMKTGMGSRRLLDLLSGEQLPRIC